MRTLALLTLLAPAGCAVRATAHPAELRGCLLYCRQAYHCLPGEIPAQLTPQTAADEHAARATRPDAAPPGGVCEYMEVGAKSYADALAAIGSAVAAWWAHGF